jgi:hypothetical protein
VIKLKIGYAVLKEGVPVRTGYGSQTAKVYVHAGHARRVAANPRFAGSFVAEVFVEVPADD